jgi:hypothetical protein
MHHLKINDILWGLNISICLYLIHSTEKSMVINGMVIAIPCCIGYVNNDFENKFEI